MPIHSSLAFGADPVTMQWSVVRGDTGTLRVEFYEDNEVDYYDTTGWIFISVRVSQSVSRQNQLMLLPGSRSFVLPGTFFCQLFICLFFVSFLFVFFVSFLFVFVLLVFSW